MTEPIRELEKLRDEGIRVSANNAERVHSYWHVRADILLDEFLEQAIFARFLAEDIREYATQRGLERPPSARAWGAVMLRAARLGKIDKCGYASTTNPRAHGTPATLWVIS